MLQVLKKGEVLCIMGDRVMGGPGSSVLVDFLGSPVSFPFSPYKLASATAAPIAVIFPHKSGHDSYVLHVARVIRVPGHLGRSPAAYRPYALEYARALEGFVQDHPFQFFNFFDMWTALPPSSPEPN
jgi:predicted LPLAT superfamily acyltransferase